MESETKNVIRVGSRKSELALIQTNYVIDCLKKLNPEKEFTVVTMTTLGDRILDVSLPKIGEKSLFTKDLEDALRNDTVDFVVHSLKDLPTTLPEGLAIGAVFEREDPRDALVLREDFKDHTLATLPEGSVIGTSSLRRTAQLRGSYPQLRVVDVRGNLNTRLRKLDSSGQYAGLLLASAGLGRMGWKDRISKILPCADMKYAVGQGALAVECRADNTHILNMLAPFNHAETYCRILAERSFLKTLGSWRRGASSRPWVSLCVRHAVECRADNTNILNMLAPFNHAETYCRILAERSFLKTLVECRADNTNILNMLAPFNHAETYCRILAERSFLKTLGESMCEVRSGVSRRQHEHTEHAGALQPCGDLLQDPGGEELPQDPG
ncbi:hypothetical protein PYW07_010858 [Mythimna separata]|uniref:hydroxymethylbilane synthase n=1 Tax=Mythimna separata TaxID=271217 RepID=A0AAD8DKS1_MYTSE|nr:hypothetical protein PYW07_010858 [Mythimna separata]